MSEEKNDDEEFHPLKIAEMMKKDLITLEKYENRQEIVEYLKDQFIANRLESSNKQESLRDAALKALMKKIEDPKIPVLTLLKIIEITGKGGEMDLSTLLGGGKGGGVNLQINNTPQNNNNIVPVQSEPTEISKDSTKDLGFLLEAMQTISQDMSDDSSMKEMKNIIDSKSTVIDPKDDLV